MWRTASRLTALQWRYLIASWLLLPLIDLALRFSGYRRTRARLSRFIPERSPTDGASDGVDRRVAEAVSIAGRRSIWPTSCLRQALLYWWFMARRGTAVAICIGVEGGTKTPFAAHAWVEHDGNILLGGEHVRERYVVLQ